MDLWNLSGTQSKSYILLFGLSKSLQIRCRHDVVYYQDVIQTQIYSQNKGIRNVFGDPKGKQRL